MPTDQDLNDRDARREKGKGRNRRGSVKNDSRLAGLKPDAPQRGSADWGEASPEWLQAVIAAATLRGMIISFKLSRDGGSYGLSLYDNGEQANLWFNGDAPLDLELERVLVFLESVQ